MTRAETPARKPPAPNPLLVAVAGVVLAIVLSIGYTTWAVGNFQAAQRQEQAQQRRQQAREHAAQQRAARTAEHRLCLTLNAIAALHPPAGGAGHKSRIYDQELHDKLASLGPDVGCPH